MASSAVREHHDIGSALEPSTNGRSVLVSSRPGQPVPSDTSGACPTSDRFEREIIAVRTDMSSRRTEPPTATHHRREPCGRTSSEKDESEDHDRNQRKKGKCEADPLRAVPSLRRARVGAKVLSPALGLGPIPATAADPHTHAKSACTTRRGNTRAGRRVAVDWQTLEPRDHRGRICFRLTGADNVRVNTSSFPAVDEHSNRAWPVCRQIRSARQVLDVGVDPQR